MSSETSAGLRRFPENFLWGTATSSYQVEGNRSGGRNSDFDVFDKKRPISKRFALPVEIGPNWWIEGEAEADFERLADLGISAQRFGIEWARINPEPNIISRTAIKRYRKMVDKLQELGMTPMATLNHFSLPYWVADRGGWANHKNIDSFKEYAEIMAGEFGDVPYWLTVNEPMMTITIGYLTDSWPPGKIAPKAAFTVYHNIAAAHNEAYDAIKNILPEAQVGNANSVIWHKPVNPNSRADRFVADFYNKFFSTGFINKTHEQTDFTGVNYHFGYHVKFNPLSGVKVDPSGLIGALPMAKFFQPDGGYKSDFVSPVAPDLFLDAVQYLHKRFKKPIIITENGIADKDDKYRPVFILTHLIALHEAIKNGADVRGYFHWASVDNLELAIKGYSRKFGLLGILDPRNPERHIRQSARLYGEIARSNYIDVNRLAEEYLTSEQQALLAKAS